MSQIGKPLRILKVARPQVAPVFEPKPVREPIKEPVGAPTK